MCKRLSWGQEVSEQFVVKSFCWQRKCGSSRCSSHGKSFQLHEPAQTIVLRKTRHESLQQMPENKIYLSSSEGDMVGVHLERSRKSGELLSVCFFFFLQSSSEARCVWSACVSSSPPFYFLLPARCSWWNFTALKRLCLIWSRALCVKSSGRLSAASLLMGKHNLTSAWN